MTEAIFKQVCLKRMLGAVISNIFIQILFLSVFILVIDVNPIHPITWINSWYNNFISLRTWIYFFPLCSVICAQGIVSSKEYITVLKLQSSRCSIMWSVFSFHNAIVAVLHIFIGYNIPWIYTSFAGEEFENFTTSCQSSSYKTCLVEERFFLLLGGVWIGFYYFMQFHVFNHRFVTFPIIQQHKLVQVKARFFNTVREAIQYVVLPISTYITLYYLRGGSLRNLICSTFSLGIKNKPMDSIFEILNVQIIFFLWLFSSIFVVSMKLMELLFKIFLTQRYIFPVFKSGEVKDITLQEGLRTGYAPIIQHLAFLDLYLLSDKCQVRRREVFTVSQPGGHPHTWNAIRKECFDIIEGFTIEFDKALKVPLKEFHLSQSVRTPFTVGPNGPELFGRPSSSLSGRPRIRPLTPPRDTSQINHQPGYKSWEYSSRGEASTIHDHEAHVFPEVIVPILSEWFNSKITTIKNLAVVNYFFGDIQETRIENLILHCLPVMWAAQSLSLLACSSLVEDNFGVMQNDLSKVILCLLQLKQVLDSHAKRVGSSKKSPKQNEFVMKMRNSLRSSVKRSLYRIAISFKLFMSDIQLPIDAEKQMLSFIAFKES